MRFHNCALAVAIAAALVAGPVLAQTASGQNSNAGQTRTLQAIEVTGSRIKGSELATSTPTLHISAQSIQKLGLTSIGEVLQQLPMAGASLNTHLDASGNFGANPDGSGVGAGAATLGLRNLNSKRTLVLVDGLRWVNGSSGSGVSASVDLNTIPMSAIQSIEILPNGASALYGSDAIAGVVNIVTKTYQPGGQFHAYYGNSSLSAGAVSKGSMSFGGQTHGFRYFMSIDQTIQQPISSATWQGSSGCIPSTGLLDCSAFIPLGQFVFTAPGGNTYDGLCPGGVCNITPDKAAGPGKSAKFPSGFRKFTNADRYVYGPSELLQLAVRTRGFYGSMEYNFTPNIQGYVRVTESKRQSENQDAPTQMGFSSTCAPGAPCVSEIAADNPYNPFGFALTPSDPNFLVQERFTGFGFRKYTQNVHTHYFSAGLNGSFNLGSRIYNWDVNFADANNDATSFGKNITNSLAVRLALGPLAACKAIPACVPLNIFGGQSAITPAMKNFITTTSVSRSHQALELWTADLSGDIVKLPAGEMQFAAGYEHRSVSGWYHPNPFSVTGITGLPTLPTQGGFSVDAGYLELNIPVLKDLPGIKSFSADFASRIAKYSTFGETADSRAALRWQPITDLTFRGTWGQGFRAPSIGELFGADQFLNELVIDPCNHDSPVMSPQVAANCKLQGVPNPATFEQQNIQIGAEVGGNSSLKPEHSRDLTLGLVYSPSWAANTSWSHAVNFTATYYKIDLKDVITSANAQNLMNRCAETNEAQFCSLIHRSASGFISLIDNELLNLGKVYTSGFDFKLNWSSPNTPIGRFGVGLSGTYVKTFELINGLTGLPAPRAPGVETGLTSSAIPRVKERLLVSWAKNNLSAQWTVRYISPLKEACASARSFPVCTEPSATARFTTGQRRMGATVYNDVRVGWKLPIKTPITLSIGANNLFNRAPPQCVSCRLNGYDAETYELPGRLIYVAANVGFGQ